VSAAHRIRKALRYLDHEIKCSKVHPTEDESAAIEVLRAWADRTIQRPALHEPNPAEPRTR